MRVFEIAAFVTLSGALHVAALTLSPPQSAGSGGGNAGAADVTLQAATPSLAAMVTEWIRAPEVSEAPSLAAPVTQSAPDLPTAVTSVTPRLPVGPLPQATHAPDMPSVETRLPAPPTPFAVPAPSALAAPAAPKALVLQMPTLPKAPSVQKPNTQLTPPQSAALPQIDTAPPAPRYAPQASIRPTLRPDRHPPRAAPAPRQTQSAQRPAQKARGSGQQDSTAQAPARKAPVASGPSNAQLAQAQKEWGARVTRALRRAHRPPRGSASGTVSLRIALSPSGQVQGVAITSSSGHSNLDQAALRAVQRARFPRAPKTLTNSVYRFSQRLTVSR